MENNNYQPVEQVSAQPPKEEKASVGLAILSFLFPIVGLIIFLVNKDKKPKTAKASGICALVSFILSIVFSVIMTVSGGLLFGSALEEGLDDDIDFSQEGEFFFDDDELVDDDIELE